MSLLFGNSIAQIAYICEPEAFDATIVHWQEVVGAGPFWTATARVENQIFRGRATDGIIEAAIGYVGTLQVEIIRPINEAESSWTAWRTPGQHVPKAGLLHHFLIDTDDYEQEVAALVSAGCSVEFTGTIFGGRKLAYLDGGDLFGHRIEVIQRTPIGATVRRLMRERSDNWDGESPLRSYLDLIDDARSILAG